ncbi:RNA polymerase sigma factor [Wenzhouxiangella sediminis]|jgi:RNA polymerase sigma-70 factor (ECF subfamily)|uniref:Sigma-70 family RNA polymerase sigma factor n=1 Tax=Wenzhouxiangella sediminis TaxID=1792836 RepID=A0A3E1K791_9GAMM|nr:sigma-70 family RNA polymerase sigma factor [Wenzhouxiangella sediminis]RFF29843.1 sigma-70 family RNA polymerase sigma factor [Wenzhouxiangella sediminis]
MSLSSPIDDLALAALKRRCRRTQERVYRRYSQPAWTLAVRLSGCEARAWDAVQQAFVLAFERIGQLRKAEQFGFWLRRILVNQVMDQHRRQAAERPEIDECGEFRDHDSALDLERAFAELDALDRQVVWLHDAEGMKHAEIAELAGQTVSWSKSRLARAREKLRNRLTADEVAARSMEHG